MNLVVLTGRLTRDPELKFGQSGKAYSRFSIAVDNPMKKGEADFINCVAFGKTAELIGEYMRKGSKIGVNGRLQMNRYEVNGEKKTTYDVLVEQMEFLDSKNSQSSSAEYSAPYQNSSSESSSQTKTQEPKPAYQEENFDDDEFPF
ncbi:MAG: single-stranded DNA-binding protein [Fusobacteriaceae bacterium]